LKKIQPNYVRVNVIMVGQLVVLAVKKIMMKHVVIVVIKIIYFLLDANIFKLVNSVFNDSICTRVCKLEIS